MIRMFKNAVFTLLILASCGNPSDKKNDQKAEETSNNDSPMKMSDNFYKKLKGKIGEDLFITVDLIKRKDSTDKQARFTGYYYYDKIGMPLDIRGEINDSGRFDMTETDVQGNMTGIFKGSFINENEIKGTWTNPKTNKVYPLSLIADKES
ncbi:MAG: hypothetical protein ACHQHP_06875, partial [Bacteroidia bacterium]